MERLTVNRIPGFHDVSGKNQDTKAAVEAALFNYIGGSGYETIETPLVEDVDLFLRMSGGELASQMYSFTAPGGHRVALRPEFTASIIRAFIDQTSQQNRDETRWRYQGPIFRYEGEGTKNPHQRTQVGGEFIGNSDLVADAEVLRIASTGLTKLGLNRLQLNIGHIGIIRNILRTFNLSERAELFLMRNIQYLLDSDKGPNWVWELAENLGMVGTQEKAEKTEDINLIEAQNVLEELLDSFDNQPATRRDLSQIQERFIRKIRNPDNPDQLRKALNFLSEFCGLRGQIKNVLSDAEKLSKTYEIDPVLLDPLKNLLTTLDTNQLENTEVLVNLGLARGIAYYTGMIFEIKHEGSKDPLCGGGRYDDLVRALGGNDLPALGFAYWIESIADLCDTENIDVKSDQI